MHWDDATDHEPAADVHRLEDVGALKDARMGLAEVTIPCDISPEEAYRPERCAYFYRLVQERGVPDLIDKGEMAELFDISRERVAQDFRNVVTPQITQEISADHRMVSQTVYRKALRELLENGEYAEATKVVDRWNEWLSERGEAETAPEKIELSTEDEEMLDELF